MKKQMFPHMCKYCILPINEKIIFSFGQTYPMKMRFVVILTTHLYKGEREFEFMLGNGLKLATFCFIGGILAFCGESGK